MKKIAAIIFLSFLFLGGILVYQYGKFNDGRVHLVFCNVGQGDGIFIRTPKGSDFLIDGGPDDKVLSCLSSHMPFWDRTIEAVILTHPHADHLTGLISVVQRYNVLSFNTERVGNTTAVYEDLVNQLKKHNIKQRFLWQDDKFTTSDGTVLTTLWPTHEWIESQNNFDDKNLDVNGFSVIMLLSYGNFKALLTGDAGETVEDKIASLAGNIDLLKVPHHGSKTGMSKQFLEIIKPKLAVISVGAKNRYGHPAPFTLDLLKSKNIKTLRTDQNGEVEIILDGKSWGVN